MTSAYENAIANQAIYKMSEVTAPENPAADFERGTNRITYMPRDRMYEGRTSIADVVKREKDPVIASYETNPVKALAQEKSIYSALLNYEFMN